MKKIDIKENISALHKCEYCGCYDGIHKSDCPFIIMINEHDEKLKINKNIILQKTLF